MNKSLLRTGLLFLLTGILGNLAITQTSGQDTPAVPNEDERATMDQVQRQTLNSQSIHKRQLDFTPFEADLSTLTDERISELDNLLTNATIPDIQNLFASGDLTSEELVLYYLHRIRAYDVNQLNTVLELNPDALTIARERDAERTVSNGALYGIPLLLKDNIGTGDNMHTTAGAYALINAHADRDAFLVTKLREAGAIILGKTNLSEWANFMSLQSSNGYSVVGGQTRNPYGTFDVGGSSSGSAASIAANFATASIGSETAGSLIYPASQNSVVTLKPSIGLISRDRIIPIAEAQDTAGPMTRNVTDLAILLTTLAGVDADDARTQQAASLAGTDFTTFLDADGLQGKRIGMIRRENEFWAGDNAILDQTKAYLEQAGAMVVEIEPLQADVDMTSILLFEFNPGVNAYLQATKAPFETLGAIAAYNREDLINRAPFGQSIIEASVSIEMDEALQTHYESLLQTNQSATASAIETALQANNLDYLLDISNYSTVLYAVSGYPAIHVPAGYRESGEPVGITFFGKYLSDGQLITVAYAFEQLSNFRKPPVFLKL